MPTQVCAPVNFIAWLDDRNYNRMQRMALIYSMLMSVHLDALKVDPVLSNMCKNMLNEIDSLCQSRNIEMSW